MPLSYILLLFKWFYRLKKSTVLKKIQTIVSGKNLNRVLAPKTESKYLIFKSNQCQPNTRLKYLHVFFFPQNLLLTQKNCYRSLVSIFDSAFSCLFFLSISLSLFCIFLFFLYSQWMSCHFLSIAYPCTVLSTSLSHTSPSLSFYLSISSGFRMCRFPVSFTFFPIQNFLQSLYTYSVECQKFIRYANSP